MTQQPKAYCPGCKSEVAFEHVGGGLCRCPTCGFQYQLAEARTLTDHGSGSGTGEVFGMLLKAFLIVMALAVVGLGVAFAGCALLLGGSHH
jgi:transposase-like protein